MFYPSLRNLTHEYNCYHYHLADLVNDNIIMSIDVTFCFVLGVESTLRLKRNQKDLFFYSRISSFFDVFSTF